MGILSQTTSTATTSGRMALCLLLAALASCALLCAAAAPAGAKTKRMPMSPILLVHGFEGSAANFEAQVMRFESNGYPHSWVRTIDYNSSAAVGSKTEVYEQIDKAIAELKSRTGQAQVDLIGHSLGTSVD